MWLRKVTLIVAVTAPMLLSVGCTHIQLRNNTIHQAQTLTDVYQKQVLDNLAMFVYDSHAVPFFALPNGGAATVTDTGNAGVGINWLSTGFNSSALNLGATRVGNGSWTLTPVTDPRKLELMRCAYQRAVAQCSGAKVSEECPNCQKRWNQFYTGDPEGHENDNDKGGEKKGRKGVTNQVKKVKSGIVTSECLNTGCCWFRVGCSKCTRRRCDWNYTGHYCGVCVFVPPGVGRRELAKLTLAVLDYATHETAQVRAKEVTAYFTADGANATSATAERVVKASVPWDTSLTLMRAESDRDSAKRAAWSEKAAVEHELRRIEKVLPSVELQVDAREKLYTSKLELELRRNYLLREIDALSSMPDAEIKRTRTLDSPPEVRQSTLRAQEQDLRTLPPQRTPLPGESMLLIEQYRRALTGP